MQSSEKPERILLVRQQIKESTAIGGDTRTCKSKYCSIDSPKKEHSSLNSPRTFLRFLRMIYNHYLQLSERVTPARKRTVAKEGVWFFFNFWCRDDQTTSGSEHETAVASSEVGSFLWAPWVVAEGWGVFLWTRTCALLHGFVGYHKRVTTEDIACGEGWGRRSICLLSSTKEFSLQRECLQRGRGVPVGLNTVCLLPWCCVLQALPQTIAQSSQSPTSTKMC